MSTPQQRPVIGISIGDLNGIGTELAIKTFSDNRLSGNLHTHIICI